MSNILVTGGAGMIGSNLVKALIRQGNNVTVVDNLWRGKLTYLEENGVSIINLDNNFYNFDLTHPDVLDSIIDTFDYIYHLADIVGGIGYVFNNQLSIFRQNILINSNVINSAKKSNSLKGFIYVGTACSFPAEKQYGIDAPPLKEDDQYPANPESAYGMSKLMGEYEAFLLEKEFNIPVSVLSLHNVYGAPCDFQLKTAQVIPSLINKAIQYPSQPFIVWGSGNQGRAFIHVDDIVNALILSKDKGLGHGLIQIGPSVCTSIRDIAENIVQISGKPIEIQYDLTKPEGDGGRCADYSKAESILGWQPQISLYEGLSSLYKWIELNSECRNLEK